MFKSNQIIICISREFASGGRIISRAIADAFDIPLYDESIIQLIAKEKNIDPKSLSHFDEVPKSIFGSRTIKGYSNSPHVNVAKLQFDFLLKKAKEGESFVVLGRCAESLLSEYPGLIKLFIMANANEKVKRVMSFEHCDEDAAIDLIRVNNKKRKDYHNYYSSAKFGDSRYYDMCINTSVLGIDETAKYLIDFIEKKAKLLDESGVAEKQ